MMTNDRLDPEGKTGSTSKHEIDLELNPREIISLFRARRKVLLGSTLAAMILTAGLMLLTPNEFTSHASILPSGGGSDLSGLMGLASNFGFGSGSATADENSSALYPSILRSNLVRDGVLSAKYELTDQETPQPIRLTDYFDAQDQNQLRAELNRITSIGSDKKLGIVRLAVVSTDRGLSQQILNEYLARLEDYLKNKRRSRASENQSYLAEQKLRRSAELVRSENALQEFMEANRNWATSTDPHLNLTLGRLKREVQIHTETAILLAQQMELASLEAQKNIPIVRLLDQPSRPTVKSGPRRSVTTIFAGLATFALIAIWIVLAHLGRQLMGERPDPEEQSDKRGDLRPNRLSRVLRLNRNIVQEETEPVGYK